MGSAEMWGRRNARRIAVAVALTVAMLAAVVPDVGVAAARTAHRTKVSTAASIHFNGRAAVYPSPAARARALSPAVPAGNLTYHGGAVMISNSAVPIYWFPSHLQDGTSSVPDPQYTTLLNQYFHDVGNSGLYGLATQYSQTVSGHVTYIRNSEGLLQAIVDTSAYPGLGGIVSACGSTNGPDCLDETVVASEVSKVINANSLPTGVATEYFVYLGPHESTCSTNQTNCFVADIDPTQSNGEFCAYHNSYQLNGKTVVFATMPYNETSTCRSNFGVPAPNDIAADDEINVTSHEQLEATTNPTGGGWFAGDTTGEVADKCLAQYAPLDLDGGRANQQWNGHFYRVQLEWSNLISGCTNGRTNSSLLWYDPNAGAVFTSMLADGQYVPGHTVGGFSKGWTGIAISRDSAVFYNGTTGRFSTGLLLNGADYVQKALLNSSFIGAKIAATCTSLVVYVPGQATISTYKLANGLLKSKGAIAIAGSYDTVVGSCDSLLLYNSHTGAGLMGKLVNGVWKSKSTGGFATGWNRITASDDSIFFMNTATEKQASGTFVNGVFAQKASGFGTTCSDDRWAATTDSVIDERVCNSSPYALIGHFTGGTVTGVTNLGAVNTRWLLIAGAH